MLFDRDPHTQQQLAGTRFGGVAIVLGKLRFQIRCAHVVIIGRIRIGVNRIALGHGCPHFGVPHHDHVQYAHFFVGELILTQLTQSLIGIQADVTSRWLKVAAQNLHEGGLAAAVGSDQAIAIAFAKLDRDIFEQRLGAELHGNVGGR